jgi:hypothetical protein
VVGISIIFTRNNIFVLSRGWNIDYIHPSIEVVLKDYFHTSEIIMLYWCRVYIDYIHPIATEGLSVEVILEYNTGEDNNFILYYYIGVCVGI